MSRIALVAGPDPGHLFPIIGLGVALARRGHEVSVHTGPDHRQGIEGEGLEFGLLPLLAPQPADADIGYRIWNRAGQMAPPLAEALRSLAPDLVVTDTLTAAGAFAAELLDIPWIEVVPHHLNDPDPALPPVGLGRRPPRRPLTNPLRWLDDRTIRQRQMLSLATGRAHRDEIRAELGLHGAGRPVIRLICSLPILEYPRSRWPGDAHLVGALAWEPHWAELVPPHGDEPLVVVTDSTASTSPRSLASTAVHGLRATSVRLAVTTSQLVEPWPGGCVVGRGPHEPLLRGAAAAVGPGGGGFLGKALRHGVPLVVVPMMGDQREAAARVAHAGVGVRLRPAALSGATLRAAVTRVLQDARFRERAAAAAAESAQLGPDYAADLVTEVLAGRRPVGRGPQR